MKYIFIIYIVLFFLVACEGDNVLDGVGRSLDEPSFEELPVEVISLPGVDRLSVGGSFEDVIRTQEEYEQLIYERYQKRLNDYCNDWFPEIRRDLERRYPELSSEEIQEKLNQECIARAPVFKGLEDVEHPEIDFSKYTLLGQGVHAGGCKTPDYDISLTSDDERRNYTFYVMVTQYGYCSMAIDRNLWIITPLIPESGEVTFKVEFERIEQ